MRIFRSYAWRSSHRKDKRKGEKGSKRFNNFLVAACPARLLNPAKSHDSMSLNRFDPFSLFSLFSLLDVRPHTARAV